MRLLTSDTPSVSLCVPTPRVRSHRPRTVYTAVFLALLCTVSLSGCGKKTDAKQSVQAESDPFLVKLEPAMADRMVVGKPQMSDLEESLNVAGRIEVDEQKLARIGSNVTGRVLDVSANIGDAVSPGKVLARISSPDLTNAQLAYLKAASAFTLAERGVDRARQLFAADVIGKAEQQRREAEMQVSQAELNAAADQLKMLGLSNDAIARLRKTGDIQTAVPVTAPRSGLIIERKVNVGQVVQPADQLFAVADLQSVWVVGGVPEQVAKRVAVNQVVSIDVPALNKTLNGKIIFVSDTVQSDTQTVTVRTVVDNSDKALKPAMLATLKIASAPQRMLTVPQSAIVREGAADYVFILVGPNQYRMTPVTLGPVSGNQRAILKGVSEDQTLVLDGAFHLNNERKRAELG